MICPSCGYENPADAVSCLRCGRQIGAPPADGSDSLDQPPWASDSPSSSALTSATSAPPAPLPSPAPRSSRRLRRVVTLGLLGVAVGALIAGGIFYYLQRQQDRQTGHWRQAPAVAGQPSPTAPAGSFLFTGINGNVVYTPPVDAPDSITWKTDHNTQDGYRIAIPANWVGGLAASGAPEGLRIYCPPGTSSDPAGPGLPPCVSYGWLPDYQPPLASDSSVADVRTLTISGVNGHQFTQAALGAGVTAYFPDNNGTFVLTANADSDAAMYAYQHMLSSLTFSH